MEDNLSAIEEAAGGIEVGGQFYQQLRRRLEELRLEDNDWFIVSAKDAVHNEAQTVGLELTDFRVIEQLWSPFVACLPVKRLWTDVFDESGATYAVQTAEPQTDVWRSTPFDFFLPDSEAQRFESRLLEELRLQNVDEGYAHPAERLLEEELVTRRQQAVAWIESAYRRQAASDPVLAAELLKCIAQLPGIDYAPWPIPIASHALGSSEIQLREAGVRVFESWGDVTSTRYLDSYVRDESVSWLADYARNVLMDINSRR